MSSAVERYPPDHRAPFNQLAAARLLGTVGRAMDLERLRAEVVSTGPYLPEDERRLAAWLEEHNGGFNCVASGCCEYIDFEPAAAALLRLRNVLSALRHLEHRWPGALARADLLPAIADIAAVDPNSGTRSLAAQLLAFAAAPPNPRDLDREDPDAVRRLYGLAALRQEPAPPLDELARLVDAERSGPVLCAACILLEHDLVAHADRVLRFVIDFPCGPKDHGHAAVYAPYIRTLNAWLDVLVHIDPSLLRDSDRLVAFARADDPALACVGALALLQRAPADHCALAAMVARHPTDHPLAAVLRARLACVAPPRGLSSSSP